MRKLAIVALLASTTNLLGAYHVARHIAVGGAGGWDYPTASGGRLYLSHSDHVEVVDIASGKVVGQIPKTDGVH